MAFRGRSRARGSRVARPALKRVVRKSLADAQKRKATWAALPLPLAPCESNHLLHDETSCPSSQGIVLIPGFVDNTTGPQNPAFEQDDTGFYVHRLELDLWIQPTWPVSNPVQLQQAAMNAQVLTNVGLVKQRWQVQSDGTAVFNRYNPLDFNIDFSASEVEGDYTEGPWMMMRNHLFESRIERDLVFYPGTCCSRVSGGSSTNTLSDGTGIINTSISTTCDVCEVDGETFPLTLAGRGPYSTIHAAEPLSWRFRLRLRRRLHFKEADGLHLFFGWEDLAAPGDPRKLQPDLIIRGMGRALVSR